MNAVYTAPIEFEGKLLDIDAARTEHLILSRGGQKLGERFMRRFVYDVVPGDAARWIRLRDDGDTVTIAHKHIASDALDGTREIEVGVDDFATANALLTMLGFASKSYQENRRTSFVLDGAHVEIDTWPRIPPYLEIEAASVEEVVRIAGLLGHQESELTGENTIAVYARYGIDLTTIADLRF